MIIGINGYSGSGKDTAGIIIQYLQSETKIPLKTVLAKAPNHEWWLEERSGWEIKKWAGKLKDIASMLTGIPKHNFEDQEFKKTLLGPEWGTVTLNPLNSIPVFADIEFNSLITVREFLQTLGTDAIRDNLHENTWVNALMADYKPKKVMNKSGFFVDDVMSKWIITDTRFPNEAEAIKKADGIIIRIERPGVKPINPHPSETSLDKWDFDYVIVNDGSLADLTKKIKKVLKDSKIL